MRLSGLILLVLTAGIVNAQDTIPAPKKIQAFPVPAIGKSLETGWYFGAVCLFKFRNLFNTDKYSTAKTEFNYTLNKQVIATAGWFLYTGQNRHILIGEQSYLYFPEYYYGVGNNTPAVNELYYTASRVELYNSLLWKINGPIYAGISAKAQLVSRLQTGTTDKKNISEELIANNAGWSYGIGPHILFDKRDRILNPSAGSCFIEVENINYLKEHATQNTNAFASLKTDVRFYRRLFSRSVLAMQYYSLNTFGHAPYRLMGLLGSDSHMRGYYQGRYRDDHYMSAQAEARVRINNWLGFTLFTGAGDVFSSANAVSINTIKYSVGGGIRVLADKTDRINLRLDYAVGRGTSGFYVAFGEAF